jgi:hypothetical protein
LKWNIRDKPAFTLFVISMMLVAMFVVLPGQASALQDGDYLYTVDGDQATITKYIGTGGDITIPLTLGGYPTVAIGSTAFYNNDNVTSVIISNGVTLISFYAFGYCSALTSVTLPDSLTEIASQVFEGCVALTSIWIPAATTNVHWTAFSQCTSLTEIEVSYLNPIYASYDGLVYSKDWEILRTCPGGKSGPIVVPNITTTILGHAFDGCVAITSVTIQSGTTDIREMAFGNNPSLTEFIVAEANPNYKSTSGVLYNKAQTKLIACPGGRTGSFAVPNGVTSIENYAFFYCAKLTSVTLSNSVLSIGQGAFSYCTGMSSIVLGNGLTKIEDSAFVLCTSLISVSIPASVTTIENNVFDYCDNLTTIEVSAANTHYASTDGVLYNEELTVLIRCPGGRYGTFSVPNGTTDIRPNAFYYCQALTSVIIPDSVTTIWGQAFFNCSALTTVTIGDGVIGIGDSAFQFCGALSSINLGKNLQDIGSYAFVYCTSLSSITLPESLMDIRLEAFGMATALTSITIPDNVTSIGGYAFYGCSNLTAINFNGMTAPTAVGPDWVEGTAEGIEGHAYAASDFPSPGNFFYGLKMGAVLTTVPGAPTSLTASFDDSQITLHWAAPAHIGLGPISGYNLYRATSDDGPFELIATTTDLGYNDTNLSEGKTYWYKVVAVNTEGEGALSSEAFAATDSGPLGDSTMLIVLAVIAVALVISVALFLFVRRKK